MTDSNLDLKAMFSPWTHRVITPAAQPGQSQAFFYHRHRHGTLVLTSRFHIRAIRTAIAIARQIFFSHLPADAPLPARSARLEPASVDIKRKIEAASREELWTYMILKDPQPPVLGYVHRDRPKEICVNFAIIDSCAWALYERETDPSNRSNQDCEIHVFFLAIVLVHEMAHALRFHLSAPNEPTPPQIRGFLNQRNETPNPNGSVLRGEGGYFMESLLFGGHICLSNALSSTHDSAQPIVIGVARKLPDRRDPEFFVFPAATIHAIIQQNEGWESLLPLKPSTPWIRGYPRHVTFRIGHDDDDSEGFEGVLRVTCGTGRE